MSEFVLNTKVIPDLRQVRTEFKKLNETSTIKVNLKIGKENYDEVVKTVETYVNDVGKKVQITTLTNSKNNELLSESVTKVNQGYKNLTKESKKVNTELNNVSKSTKKVGQSFSDIITKVGKFYLATVPIQMVQKVVMETVDVIKDFDNALTEFKKVSDLSGESLDNYTEKLGELGSSVGRTR